MGFEAGQQCVMEQELHVKQSNAQQRTGSTGTFDV
jgi:hypothetical protein